VTVHVPDRQGSRAFLVGVPTVAEGGFEELGYVDRNLEDLSAALSHPGHGILTHDSITVLRSPSRSEWLKELKRVGQETSDLLFFYFVGHGHRDPFDNRLYLMTHHADLGVNLIGTAVAWSHVLQALEDMHFRRAVFILDCCNSGLAAEGRGVGKSGHYILASALPTKTQPSDSVESGRSRFTHEIISAMTSVERGTDDLTMQGLYDRLYAATKNWPVNFGDGWGPKGGSSGDGPDIVIASAGRGPADGVRTGWSGRKPPVVPVSLDRIFVPPRLHPERDPQADMVLDAEPDPEGGSKDATREPTGEDPASGKPRWPVQWWKAVLTGCVVLLLVVGVGAYVISRSGGGGSSAECPPPLELRLMTGTETRDAVSRAVTAYVKDRVNRQRLGKDDDVPEGCRRVNFTVYEAGTRETVAAFGAATAWAGQTAETGASPPGTASGASGPCPAPSAGGQAGEEKSKETAELCVDPLQDVGPQPDLLLAGSSTELERIQAQLKRQPGPATVSPLGPVGYSPLVLAVPAALKEKLAAQGVRRTGSTWDELLAALRKAAPGMPLLRPDPDTSSTGLQHTLGLYEARDGWLAGGAAHDAEDVEKLLRHDFPPAADADSLLCALEEGKPKQPHLGEAAALVSEKAVADFNLGVRPGSACGNSKPADDTSRLLAYYPKGVPALDMPLTRVSWDGSKDGDRRKVAIRKFYDWLVGKGHRHFLDGLVRGVADSGDRPAPSSGQAWKDMGTSGVLKAAPVVTETVDGPTADAVVADYTRTREPGQVLFLVDVSGSMAEGGKRALVEAALRGSIQRLGPQDTYGIWSYPKSAKEPVKAGTVIERGTPGNERAKALSWAQSLSKESMSTSGAAVYEVLERALRETRGDDRPLIVLITDGDDRPEGGSGGAELTAMREQQQKKGSAEVLVLSVRVDGCAAEIRQFENPGGAGCFSGRPDRAAEALAEKVANRVQGGTGDEEP
jgi:hypothetical protein